MPFLVINADLSRSATAQERTAIALERIADALERIAPPIPAIPSEPASEADLLVVTYKDQQPLPEDELWREYGPRENYDE